MSTLSQSYTQMNTCADGTLYKRAPGVSINRPRPSGPLPILNMRTGAGDAVCAYECTGGSGGPSLPNSIPAKDVCTPLLGRDGGNAAGDFLTCYDQSLNACISACGFSYMSRGTPTDCGAGDFKTCQQKNSLFFPSVDAFKAAKRAHAHLV